MTCSVNRLGKRCSRELPGDLRQAAIPGSTASPLFPGVPTTASAAITNYEAGDWIGILAPKLAPKSVIIRLNDALSKWPSDPHTTARLAQMGFEARSSTPEEFGTLLRMHRSVRCAAVSRLDWKSNERFNSNS